MYCINCGSRIADSSAFCPHCGAKTQAPATPAQAAPEVYTSFQGDAAAAVKPKKNLKIAIIILAVIAFIGLAVWLTFIIIDAFKKPGTEIVNAFDKTMKEDFKAELELKYDLKGISALSGNDDEDSASAMSSLGSLIGTKIEAELYVMGEGDDFQAKLDAGFVQMRVDSEGITNHLSTEGLGAIIGGSDRSAEDKTVPFDDEESKEFFDIVASRDIVKAMSENKEVDKALKKNFSENYSEVKDVFADLLNDTDAEYVIEYSKKDGAYNYTIDVMKLLEALTKDKTLDMKKESVKGIRSLIKETKQDIIIELSVSISGGKLDTVKMTPKVDDNELGTLTVTFKDYGKVSDEDLEFGESNISGGINDSVLAPSMKNYISKSKLKTTNANAKMAFVSIASAATDLEADGEYVPSGTFCFRIEDYDPDDKIQASLYENFNYMDNMGEVYYVIEDGQPKFVQWREDSSSIVGQYPGPATNTDDTIEWGTFTTF